MYGFVILCKVFFYPIIAFYWATGRLIQLALRAYARRRARATRSHA